MKKVGDILAMNNDQIGRILRVRKCWEEIVGDVLVRHAEPVIIKKGTLLVMCDSPAWAQQIDMHSILIKEQVGKIAGVRLQKVEGKFGMVSRPCQKIKSKQTIARPDIDPADVLKIKDKRLGDAIRAFMGMEEGICGERKDDKV